MKRYKKECFILIGIVVVLSFVSYCIFNSSIKENFINDVRPPRIYNRDSLSLTGDYTSSKSFIHDNKVMNTIYIHIGKPDNLNLTVGDESYMILPNNTKVNLISHGYGSYISKPEENKPTYHLEVQNENLSGIDIPKILIKKVDNGITTNIGTRLTHNFNIPAEKILDINQPSELEKLRIKNGFSKINLEKDVSFSKPRPNFQYFIDLMNKWPYQLDTMKAVNKTSNKEYIDFIKKNGLETIKLSIQRVFKSPISHKLSMTSLSNEIDLKILDGDSAYQQIIIQGYNLNLQS